MTGAERRSLIYRWSGLFRRDAFSRRIVTGVLPAVVLLVILMGAFSYYLLRRQILAGVQTEIDAMAQQASLTLQAFFQQRSNDLESLSETPLIKDYLKNIEFGLVQEAAVYRQEIERHFRNFARRSQVYDDILYVRPDGAIVSSARKGAAPGDHFETGSDDFFQALSRGAAVAGVLETRADGAPLMRYAKPVFDEGGAFQGAVVLDCDLRRAYEALQRLRVGERGVVSIEDAAGREVLGQRSRAQVVLTGQAPLPGTPLVVTVSADEQGFLGPLTQIKYLTLFFSISVFFIVLLFILPVIDTLVAPVRDMVAGTQRFASGDLSYRVAEPASWELRILAASFNRMAENLEERTRELEQRLRQLTALREMDGAVIQRLDEEVILKTCLEAVARGFNFDRTGLYWIDAQAGEIAGRMVYGMDRTALSEKEFRARRLPLSGKDIICEVVRSRKAALVKDLEDPRLIESFIQQTKTREFVLAPICGKDKVWGVLAADNYYGGRALTESDKEGLTLFANAVGLALENAMLFQTLAESEARTRAILENSPEAIIGLSKEHWIASWNRGAEAIFGYSAREIRGKPLAALFGPNAEEASTRLLSEVMAKGAIRDYAMPGMRKDGRRLELSLSWGGSFPDFWMNKEWTVVIRDVTEARKLQQQVIRSEKMTAVGQLISGIAHELNNPLQAVVGYAEIVSGELGPTDARSLEKDLKVINENAVRCMKIIENLLLFVRQGEVEKKAVALDKVVRASVELLGYKLRKVANIAVTVDVPKGLPPVHANFQQLQQVFVNLINNACDAMSGSSGEKSIAVRAARRPGRLRVEVSDNGPGVPPELLGRLFEPFFTTKSEGRGTGLGLAVCRQILKEHGGTMGCASEPGRGATFWLELPWAAAEKARRAGKPRGTRPVSGKSLLLVDDEPDVLSLLAKVVTAAGNSAETARSIREASARLKEGNFDLVVADIRLDDGSGVRLWDEWERWTSRPRPPFLFMTGDVINPALAKDIEARGAALLHKPIDLQTFQGAVRSLLSGKTLRLK